MQRLFRPLREKLPIEAKPGAPAADLPRRVMRHALVVAAGALVAAAVLGLVDADEDLRTEAEAALALATNVASVAGLESMSDREALEALAATRRAHPMRHLELRVVDGDGRLLLAPPLPEPVGWPLRGLVQAHRALHDEPVPQRVTWRVPRPDGRSWTIALAVTHESERIEAVSGWLSMVAVLTASLLLMLAVMDRGVRRGLAPLQAIVGAIGALQRGDAAAVERLAPVPVRELDAIRVALKQLVDSLAATESARRALDQKLITLQEDERAALARELHDELGQRLTALRVDAAWLLRQGAPSDDVRMVLEGLSQRCAEMQLDVRRLLARLRPLGPDDGEPLDVDALRALLQVLAEDWRQGAAPAPRLDLVVESAGGRGRLPRSAALALYRISQEALTNAVRHAQATHVHVAVRLDDDAVDWSVRDDGVGIADLGVALRSGNGLGGMRERVWALGGEMEQCPSERGLHLAARWPLPSGWAA